MQFQSGMKRHLFGVIATVLTVVGVAGAGEPTDSLKTRVDLVLALLEQSGDRRAEIRKVAEETFDVEEMSRRALGQHWKARTPEERREFMTLFADLLERSYIARVESGRGGKVNYTGETVTGDEATVRTRILTPQRTEVPVDYRMHRKDGRWQVYDLNIEGVSLIANYRSQFDRIIRTSSYAELVKRLRKQGEFLQDKERRAGGA